ncbi:DEKNAAC103554 [Brettanomyces naardenensis]|uniref:DEKNAAC103554 n=1 Tax=Brettanomyces naardenensis TaxID=13370 RepID=A0A448YP11_BRENA|nr:DEKNAAC103554 [Brettanomyces naardenensis]
MTELAKKYGDVYQIRLGTRLAVVANSYDSIIKLWCCKSVRGNNSRPIGNSFHNLLSREGIYTIGTTPFGQDYLQMRKFVSTNVLSGNRGKGYNSRVINRECDKLIMRLLEEEIDKNPNGDIVVSNEMTKEGQYFHLAVALIVTYGYQMDYSKVQDRLEAEEISFVENQITKVRSHVQNFQDYLPNPFRYFVNLYTRKTGMTRDLYERRKRYLDKYLRFTQSNLDHPNNSIRKSLMYRYFTKEETTISKEQIASVCLTMVSAGLDNTPLNFKYELHQLNHSPHIVERAYKELTDCYHGDPAVAYQNCHKELKCDYIVAIVKETLRLFTVLPMALPRETTEPISYGSAIIPKGTVLFMNCWAGNHDERATYKPMEFIPDRFLEDDKTPELKHFAFGIGSRMCLGNHLAFQELYILTCKFILLFEFQTPKLSKLNPLALNKFPESIAIEPESFDIELKVRSQTLLDRVVREKKEAAVEID